MKCWISRSLGASLSFQYCVYGASTWARSATLAASSRAASRSSQAAWASRTAVSGVGVAADAAGTAAKTDRHHTKAAAMRAPWRVRTRGCVGMADRFWQSCPPVGRLRAVLDSPSLRGLLQSPSQDTIGGGRGQPRGRIAAICRCSSAFLSHLVGRRQSWRQSAKFNPRLVNPSLRIARASSIRTGLCWRKACSGPDEMRDFIAEVQSYEGRSDRPEPNSKGSMQFHSELFARASRSDASSRNRS